RSDGRLSRQDRGAGRGVGRGDGPAGTGAAPRLPGHRERRAMTVAIAIIVVNVAVSLAGFRALPRPDGAGERFLFVPYQVARGENGLGMLLAHFAHGSWLHLGFNMFALYTFAGTVLGALDPVRFLLIYVVAGIGSDLIVFALHKDDP